MKFVKIISILSLVCMTSLFMFGCSNESEDQQKTFEETLAQQTSEENKYEGMPYLGDWYLAAINSGETDDNGEIIWGEPDYLETLNITSSGLITDKIEDDAIEGYILPIENDTETEAESNEDDPNKAFKAVFYYEDNIINIYFIYSAENNYLVVMFDDETISCVYFPGSAEVVTMLEDGTYVDEDGNVVELSEDELINNIEDDNDNLEQ